MSSAKMVAILSGGGGWEWVKSPSSAYTQYIFFANILTLLIADIGLYIIESKGTWVFVLHF